MCDELNSFKIIISMDSEMREEIWKDNDVEIYRHSAFSAQYNSEVEKFMVTIRPTKTDTEDKQKKLIDVLKLYNG